MPTRAEFAKIHIAIKELGISDDAYRDTLKIHFNKTSSKNLTNKEVGLLLAHFRGLGWKPRYKAAGKKSSLPLAQDRMSRKIRALWITLHKIGAVRDSSEHALAKFAKRVTGVAALQWHTAEQKGKVIAALKQWSKRLESHA
jgi:phage gp16-like protein